MKDILGIAISVATPLSLLGLVAAFAFVAYQRRLRSAGKQLELLPPKQRATSVDSYLTRYGIDVKGFSEERRFELINDEMDRRHRRASFNTIVAATAGVICFVVAAVTYAFHSNAESPSSDNKQKLPSVDPPTKLARLSLQLQRMKLAKQSGLQLGKETFKDKDRAKVVQQAAAWVEKTLRNRFPQTDALEFEVAVVSGPSGSGKATNRLIA